MSLINELIEKRNILLDTIEATIETSATEERDLTDAETANVENLSAQVEKLSERINQLKSIEERRAEGEALQSRAGAPVVKVNEGELYRENGEYDFVRDVLAMNAGSAEARDRLYAHNEEYRATVTGDLGGFVVPEYALSLYADKARQGSPTANIMSHHALTAKTITIPVQTSSASVNPQENELDAPSPVTDFESTGLDVHAKTIHGISSASVQSLDFGSISTSLIVEDLTKELALELNDNVLNGNGASGAATGIISTATATSNVASPSISDIGDLWKAVNAAKADVHNETFRSADTIIMNPSVFSWIQSALDQDDRPIYGFGYSNGQNVQGTGLVWNGLNVVLDAQLNYQGGATPVNYATDIIVCTANEGLLWTAPIVTLTVDQVGASVGRVDFVARQYFAFTSARRPGSFQVLDVTIPA